MNTMIGYARCSTDKQDLAAQQEALLTLGVTADRIYTDRGFTGTNRTRPDLDQALAAVRSGDTWWCPSSTVSPAPFLTPTRSGMIFPRAA